MDLNLWRSSTILRYAITIAAASIASRMSLSASQTGEFQDWLLVTVMGAVTFAPLAWNMIFRPSNAAMDAAVKADTVLAGDTRVTTVKTVDTLPDLEIKAKGPNVGHS